MPPDSFSSTTKFRLSREAILKWFDNQVVFVHMRTGRMHMLSPIASYIWKLAFEGNSHADLERLILSEFDVSKNQLLDEMNQLFTSLQREKLIESSD